MIYVFALIVFAAQCAYLIWSMRQMDSFVSMIQDGRKLRSEWENLATGYRAIAVARGKTIAKLERVARRRRCRAAAQQDEAHRLRRLLRGLDVHDVGLMRNRSAADERKAP